MVIAERFGDEPHQSFLPQDPTGPRGPSRKRRTGPRRLVERIKKRIEEVTRYDRHGVMLAEHLVGATLRGGTGEVAGGFLGQRCCLFDPSLGFGSEAELKAG
jgi:hypothetical protein